MRRVITNPELQEAIRFLKVKAKENKAKIWEAGAEHLSGPRRVRATINLSRLSRFSKTDTAILVPGKVLGTGIIKHAVVVGAFQFSQSAKTKIERAGGKCLTIKDFVAHHPKGSKVQIMR